ncbi:MAG: phage major capsid protein [Flavihumibacter sp.]|nr:phage major capsid protein [Flavihumibacter sp.]
MPLTNEEIEVIKKAAGDKAVEETKALLEKAEKKFQEDLEKATKTKAADGSMVGIQETLEAIEAKVKGVVDSALKQGEEINKLKEGNNDAPTDTKAALKAFREEVKAKAEEFKTIAEKSAGVVRLEKAATTISTTNFGAGVLQGLRETEIDHRHMRERFIMTLITIINGGADSDPLSWLERRPKEGAAALVAESAAKPNIDFTWVEGKVSAEYIAGVTPVTRKALTSMSILENEIMDVLDEELMDTVEEYIIRNSGAVAGINSIWSYAKAFTGSGLATKVNNANIMDVLRATILQCRKGNPADAKHAGRAPNVALISLDTEALMDTEKATDGHYILPPFMAPGNVAVKGVRIVGNKFLADDEFLTGDMSRYAFNIVDPVKTDVGYINDQFVKNELTIRAEMRGNGRVKYHDTWAFVRGTFTAAKAALETP